MFEMGNTSLKTLNASIVLVFATTATWHMKSRFKPILLKNDALYT